MTAPLADLEEPFLTTSETRCGNDLGNAGDVVRPPSLGNAGDVVRRALTPVTVVLVTPVTASLTMPVMSLILTCLMLIIHRCSKILYFCC